MTDDTACAKKRRGLTYDMTCAECGAAFTGTMSSARYCSAACRRERWLRASRENTQQQRQARRSVTCAECGGSFVPKRAGTQFCSKTCANVSWKRTWRQANPEAARAEGRRGKKRHYASTKADPEQWAALQQYNRGRYEAERDIAIERAQIRTHGPEWKWVVREFWEAQEGLCYLCGDPLVERKRYALDHDHNCCTGGTCEACRRGLACLACNLLIGHAKDDPDRLRRIADNLERAKVAVRSRMAEGQGVLFVDV